MYDTYKERSESTGSGRGGTGVAVSAGWLFVVLAISILVAWAELSDDQGTQSVIPEESACLHPRVCVG